MHVLRYSARLKLLPEALVSLAHVMRVGDRQWTEQRTKQGRGTHFQRSNEDERTHFRYVGSQFSAPPGLAALPGR